MVAVTHNLAANQRFLLAADLHLSESYPARLTAFAQMMQQSDVDAIYLLGDIFDVWVGDDENSAYAEQARQIISQTVARGVKVYIQHGNRDFLLGRRFCRMTGCFMLPDFCVLSLAKSDSESNSQSNTESNIPSQRLLLTHGDLLCDDAEYLRYRKRVRGYRIKILSRILPLRVRQKIASRMREGSSRQRRPAVISVERATAALREMQCATLIHGHTHQAGEAQWQDNGEIFRRRCLPDWEGGENAPAYVMLVGDGTMTQHAVQKSA